ncbi:MAG: hypothetical protein MUC41_16540 [Syntrophobacteraceae bacterium]|nr:hypothetical protein [Syntrophobacteraceae bacterium]
MRTRGSRGNILSIDTSESEKMPGVFKVVGQNAVKGNDRITPLITFRPTGETVGIVPSCATPRFFNSVMPSLDFDYYQQITYTKYKPAPWSVHRSSLRSGSLSAGIHGKEPDARSRNAGMKSDETDSYSVELQQYNDVASTVPNPRLAIIMRKSQGGCRTHEEKVTENIGPKTSGQWVA